MKEPAAPEPARSVLPKRLLWALGLVAFLASGVAALAWSQREAVVPLPQQVTLEELNIGNLGAADRAPDFTVPTIDGGRFSLYESFEETGKPVFLNFWASWCIPCRKEMPAIELASVRFPNVEFVGVAVQDDPAAAEAFARELGVTYIIGLDERDKLAGLYPTLGLPATYLISSEGVILQPLYGELDLKQLNALISTWFGG